MGDWREVDDDEGERVPAGRLERLFKIGSMSVRVGLSSLSSKIRSYLSSSDPEARREQLRRAFEENAEHVAEVLGQLKGASMKVGQLMSTDPDILPEGFSEVMASLQQDAPPMEYETVVRQIEEGLGREIASVFAFFDPEPIGAASIGQVHRARLDDGTDVAVKVQYPGIVDALESDLRALRQLLVLGRVAVDGERLEEYFDEVRRFVLEEADYRREATHMERFADVLDAFPGVEVPRPFFEWSSESILVMELAEGERFEPALRKRSVEEQREILGRWIEMYLWLVHERQLLHGDPHPGNFLLDGDRIRVLDFGCVAEFDAAFTDGLLELLVACWDGDTERAIAIYGELGFSTERSPVDALDPELLERYHSIVLEPLLSEGPFDFGEWKPTMRAKKFILRHPSFFALVPPRDALLYYRVLGGIRGLLRTLDVELDVRSILEGVARRRGVLH